MAFVLNSLPIDGPLRITSPFGPRDTGINGASTLHMGVDIGRDFAKSKTDILAVKAGKVKANFWNNSRGWVVLIQHADNYATLYQHLAFQSPAKCGSHVKSGDVIGVMGDSGISSGVHLHFEVRENGTPIDPEPHLRNIKEIHMDMTKKELVQVIQNVLDGNGSKPSNWAKDSWARSTEEGIVDGTRPKGYTTREQVQQMIRNAFGREK